MAEEAPLDVRVGGSTNAPATVTDSEGYILGPSGERTDMNLFDRTPQAPQDGSERPSHPSLPLGRRAVTRRL